VITIPTEPTDGVRRPPIDGHYANLLSFIISNAAAGEIVAIENYTEMVPLFDRAEDKIELVRQAADEGKHLRMLVALGRRLGFAVEERIVESNWLRIRRHFGNAVASDDATACFVIQDLLTESMAIALYSVLAGNAEPRTDPETARVAAVILKDEVEHRDMGAKRLRRLIDLDHFSAHRALISAFHQVAPELFGMISTSCESLCGVLGLDCSSLNLSAFGTDLDTVRSIALDELLCGFDLAGFDPRVTQSLLASLARRAVASKQTDEFPARGVCSPGSSCC
jgi:fatty aldehyde decarbonylase